MFLYKCLIFSIISLTFNTVRTQDDEIISNLLDGELTPVQNLKADLLLMEDKMLGMVQEIVDIQVYYECLCPDCRTFDTTEFKPIVEKLASNLNVKIYPYGNAKTIDNGNGTYEFSCQHGPKECYGNMLHACAIDFLNNVTKAVFFNSCMMEYSRTGQGSDDKAADECGKSLNVDTEAIKQCAKGPKGSALLKFYGDESRMVGFHEVPYVLINGVVDDVENKNFTEDVCAAFKTPPPACA